MPKGNPKGASSKATPAAPVVVRIAGGPDTWLNHLPDEHSKFFEVFCMVIAQLWTIKFGDGIYWAALVVLIHDLF